MISGQLYMPVIYNVLLFLVFFYSYMFYTEHFRNELVYKWDVKITIGVCVIATLFIGLRPLSPYFGDTMNYARGYVDFQQGMEVAKGGDWIFYNLMKCSSGILSIKQFFLLIATLYFGCTFWACKRLFDRYLFLAFLMTLTAFSFWSYSYNGLRNGLAAAITLLAFSFFNRKIISGILFFLAVGIHKSMLLPIISFVIVYFFNDTKRYMTLWVLSILFSYFMGDFWENLFADLGFGDDRFGVYLLSSEFDDQFSHVGFRWDFLAYSSIPIILGYYLIVKRGIYDRVYLLLLNTYILSNSFWILIIRAAFSNRFAYLSWFLYPIVLIYPLLHFPIWKDQHRKVAFVLIFHFSFTYGMWLIGKL